MAIETGTELTIPTGTFKGLTAVVTRIDGQVAHLEARLAGRAIPVTLRLDELSVPATVDVPAVVRGLAHFVSLLRAEDFDAWWARAPGGEPVATWRAFEAHVDAFEGRATRALADAERDLRGLETLPSGWLDARRELLEGAIGASFATADDKPAARERRARTLAALEAAGERPRYVGHRGGP